MRRIRILLTSFAIGAACHCAAETAGAEPIQAVSLFEAYQAAWAHDPRFRAARAEQQAGLEHETLGQARVLPSITAVVSTNRNSATVNTSDGNRENRGDYTSSTRSIQLRQPLYDAEAWAARRQGRAKTAASEATFRAKHLELAVRVFDAYGRVVLSQHEVALARAQLLALDGQLQANERRLVLGEGTRTEILETGSKRAVAQARLLELEDTERGHRAALQALTGRPVQRVWQLPLLAAPVSGADPRTLDDWRALARADNPELAALRSLLTAAQEEIKRAESGHRPKLDFLMSQGRSQSDTTATYQQTSQTRTMGVQLNVPLYAGGAVSAQIRQAAAQWQKAQADLDTREAELEVELLRHHAQHTHGRVRIEALAQAWRHAEALVEATVRSVVGGERTNADVLVARERLTQVGRDLAEARLTQLQAGLRLKSLAAVLTEEDLSTLSASFLPAAEAND